MYHICDTCAENDPPIEIREREKEKKRDTEKYNVFRVLEYLKKTTQSVYWCIDVMCIILLFPFNLSQIL